MPSGLSDTGEAEGTATGFASTGLRVGYAVVGVPAAAGGLSAGSEEGGGGVESGC